MKRYYYGKKFMYNFIMQVLNKEELDFIPSEVMRIPFSEKLKACYEAGYTFDNKPQFMFFMIVHTNFDNNYIKEHMEEFKKFIIEIKYIGYALDSYKYMKANLSEYMDEHFLIELYKKRPRFFFYDNDVFKNIAEKIPNNSPKIKLTDELPACNLKYRPYDLYAGLPAYYINDELSDFESRFLYNNDLIIKLYNLYYKSYKSSIKDDKLDNLYDFIKTILLNQNNFKNVANNQNFSAREIESLIFFKHSLGQSEREKFEHFYEKYQNEERNKWIYLHNELVKYKNDYPKCIEIFEKYGFNKDNLFTFVLNNKFMNKNIKSLIIELANICYGNTVKVIDIIDLLDEMIDRELTLDEILKEREISKKTFDKLYQDSYENNPILYEYIKMSLSKNKRLGYRKLIKLGYAIINNNLQSYSEFKEKFPKYDYNNLLIGLKDTELEEQLKTLAASWKDYEIDVKQPKM